MPDLSWSQCLASTDHAWPKLTTMPGLNWPSLTSADNHAWRQLTTMPGLNWPCLTSAVPHAWPHMTTLGLKRQNLKYKKAILSWLNAVPDKNKSFWYFPFNAKIEAKDDLRWPKIVKWRAFLVYDFSKSTNKIHKGEENYLLFKFVYRESMSIVGKSPTNYSR